MRTQLAPNRPFLAGAALALLTLTACAQGSGHSTPTQPLTGPTTISGASISGTVSAPGGPAAGVRVRVDGSASSATTDSAGRFLLGGVPSGDRVLTFETAQASPAVSIPRVQPSETIQMAVALSGSSAQISSITRSSDSSGTSGDTTDGTDDGTDGEDPEDDPPPPTGTLTLSFSPSEWEVCSEDNNGNLTAFVRGPGYDTIDPTTVLLSGDDASASPLAPSEARVEGDHFKARFSRQAAFGLLLQPLLAGEVRTLTLAFSDLGGVPAQVSADVTISSCEEDGDDDGTGSDDQDEDEGD